MKRALRCLAVAVLATAILTGCQMSTSDPFGNDGKDHTVNLDDRPPMETMLAGYRAFQADLFAQLDERFGRRTWHQIPNSLGFDRAGCSHGEPSDGEEVALPDMTFEGAYPAERSQEVRDLVIGIGKKYGFTYVTMIKDEVGDLDFFGHDTFGASYEFGMATNTVFGIRTGCHRWNVTPSPSPTPTPVF